MKLISNQAVILNRVDNLYPHVDHKSLGLNQEPITNWQVLELRRTYFVTFSLFQARSFQFCDKLNYLLAGCNLLCSMKESYWSILKKISHSVQKNTLSVFSHFVRIKVIIKNICWMFFFSYTLSWYVAPEEIALILDGALSCSKSEAGHN